MQLLNKNRIHFIRYENETKRSSVMNDFHSPKTNGGYSRSKTGGIYYKWRLIFLSFICIYVFKITHLKSIYIADQGFGKFLGFDKGK